ncbi:MAG: 30S ribosomal protein S13 [Elusimicrobiales bacterium]|nr:30S ribosomal protein S13 [Elusimicrobiales bacterium]
MARIVGLDLPRNKRIDIALTYVFGIGNTLAKKILKELGNQVDPSTRVRDLTEEQTGLINSLIIKEYRVEGELRREISQNLKRYIEIGSYRGVRHRRSLPSRGQRTKTNGRTRRGRRKTIGSGGGK